MTIARPIGSWAIVRSAPVRSVALPPRPRASSLASPATRPYETPFAASPIRASCSICAYLRSAAFLKLAACFDRSDQGVDDVRIEVGPRAAAQLGDRVLDR